MGNGTEAQNACRSLDLIIDGARSLKEVIRKAPFGGVLDMNLEWEKLWCPMSLWSSAGTIFDFEDAKSFLRTMKSAKEFMGLLSTTLEDAIEAVSEPVIQESREWGLASLPNEVLAQVFELCHLDGLEREPSAPDSLEIFVLVCKRFRNIATHLPILWQNVFERLGEERLAACATRCSNLSVHIGPRSNLPSTTFFLDHIHPHHKWEELDLQFMDEEDGHRLFNLLFPRIQTPFSTLKHLSIRNHGQKNNDNGELGEHTILHADELVLASWQFPNVTTLKLRNILPSMNMQCPKVSRFEFILPPRYTRQRIWELQILRDFLQSMPVLESLVVTFQDHTMFSNNYGLVDPLALPSLRSLSIMLGGRPSLLIVSRFMDLLNTERLTKLEIRIYQGEQSWPSFDLVPPARKLDGADGEWMNALFVRSDHQRGHVRSFPAVVDFTLDLRVPSPSRLLFFAYPYFDPMFVALPNVKNLSLKLPEFVEIDLMEWVKEYEGLQELRTMRVAEYLSLPTSYPKYSPFFSKFSRMACWDKFEKLEVVDSPRGSLRLEDFEAEVGKKLVRLTQNNGSHFFTAY